MIIGISNMSTAGRSKKSSRIALDRGSRRWPFCDPTSNKYRDKYAEIARRPTHAELEDSWRRARELGLEFETASFERRQAFDM
jgi:hypothetical protein